MRQGIADKGQASQHDEGARYGTQHGDDDASEECPGQEGIIGKGPDQVVHGYCKASATVFARVVR